MLVPDPKQANDGDRAALTVAICTHNRARLLDETLASLAACARPQRHELEILVIANACTDDSESVVERHSRRLPVRAIVEPQAGLSHARNTAIQHARGNHILWTDDDVRVSAGWLTAYERAFAAWPDAKVFGGAVQPVFENGPPPWLAETLHLCESAFAARAVPADAPIDPARDGFPYGANFAIESAAQRARPYAEHLGRRPGRRIIGGEELLVIASVMSSGATGRWIARAGVEHVIAPDRQTAAYLRAYFEGHGYVLGLEDGRSDAGRFNVSAMLAELKAILRLELRFRRSNRSSRPMEWVPALIEAAIARGRFSGRRAAQVPPSIAEDSAGSTLPLSHSGR